MLSRGITTVVALGVLVTTILVLLPDISQTLEAARTDPFTESVACTTGAAESACSVALASPHEYSTTDQMTVTETAPGAADHTANATLAESRQSVSVASLSTSTAYTFSIDYAIRAANVDQGANDLLRLFIPMALLILIGALLAAFGAPIMSRARG
jgi:hypothetical protein|tara:strand:- start:576 stop:1043 length:468 start_codon:yes stop_codon:yes gene_type:complete